MTKAVMPVKMVNTMKINVSSITFKHSLLLVCTLI